MMKKYFGASLALLSFAAFNNAQAQDNFGRPNTTTGVAPVDTNFSGQTFTNYGLVGAGRVAANAKDFNGDTLGSFSSMAIDLTTWRKSAAGYSGTLYTLPDRGYNVGATLDDFTNYAGRINVFNLTFNPASPATPLAASTASQNQIQLAYDAAKSFFLKDFNGVATTGEDPSTGTTVQNGYTLPQVKAPREGAGRVSIDAEALILRPDGSFYVGDEYSGGVYYFDKTGKMSGFISPVEALTPRIGGAINYTAFTAPTTGRRNNQGMEGVSMTPDGSTLFAVLQSATMQDSATDQSTRLNTRVLVYDVSKNPTPSAPTAHYVLQLPTLDKDGTNGAADRTAAQSEVLALNNTQFLLLTRDGNGLDNGNSDPIVFKSIYIVDTNGATNLAGTQYETTTTPVSPGGVLNASITPVKSAQLVNVLNTEQLNLFGLNIDANPATLSRQNNRLTLSEKWEALALAPTLEENKPQDFFLFVGNDNDFKTTEGVMVGDAQYSTYNAGVENDSLLLVYRVSLPTYVDPQYRAAMVTAGPLAVASLGAGIEGVAQENSINIASHLDSTRRLRAAGLNGTDGGRMTAWGGFGYSKTNSDSIDSEAADATLGLGYALTPNIEIGLAAGWQGGDGDGAAYSYNFDAAKFSIYAGYTGEALFANASYTFGDLGFDDIARPAGFGQTAIGSTGGESHNFRIEGGAMFPVLESWALGPVAGVRYLTAELDGYQEHGASGGNLTYGKLDYDSTTYFVGGEVAAKKGPLLPSLRVTYNFSDDDGFGSADVRLTSALSPSGAASISAPKIDEDTVAADLSLTGMFNNISWRAGYAADVGVDSNDVDHRISAGFGFRF